MEYLSKNIIMIWLVNYKKAKSNKLIFLYNIKIKINVYFFVVKRTYKGRFLIFILETWDIVTAKFSLFFCFLPYQLFHIRNYQSIFSTMKFEVYLIFICTVTFALFFISLFLLRNSYREQKLLFEVLEQYLITDQILKLFSLKWRGFDLRKWLLGYLSERDNFTYQKNYCNFGKQTAAEYRDQYFFCKNCPYTHLSQNTNFPLVYAKSVNAYFLLCFYIYKKFSPCYY